MLFEIVSSKAFLIYLIGGWIIYYITSAIWTKEAFANFVLGLEKNSLIQTFYMLFLISLYLNFIRMGIRLFRENKKYLLLWLPLPVGIIIFFTAFFVSINVRQMERLLVGEGEIVAPYGEAGQYMVSKVYPALREDTLGIEATGSIFAHEPKIVLTDEMQNNFEIGVYPPKKIRGTYYHILNFGLAPGVRLMEDNNIKTEGYMALRILPPGNKDFFEIPPYPYRFSLKLIQPYNLKSPTYEVRIFKGERVVFEGDLKDRIGFDNLELSFFEPAFWVLLEIVKDPAVPFILLGIFLSIIGIPMSLLRLILKFLGFFSN
jgi:hypothetical protein